MMGDQAGPHKANQYFSVVPGVIARETSLRDTSTASEDIIAVVPLGRTISLGFWFRLPVHNQALPINHSDTKVFWIVDIVIDPPLASPGRLGGEVHFAPTPASGAGADLAGKRSNADETILRNRRNPPETCAG
jgi:hypothetical protein